MSSEKSSKEQKEFIRQQLVNSEVFRDSLPYHKKFEELYREYRTKGFPELSRNEYWLLILRVCKQGNAKQINSVKLPPVCATEDAMRDILLLIPANAGRRNRLPYTEKFEQIYETYKRQSGTDLTQNEFWRLLLRVGKATRSKGISHYVRDIVVSMNPWWNNESSSQIPDYRRNAFRKLYDSLKQGRYPIIALRGPRRVGKTVLLRQMIHDLIENDAVPPCHILRIQFDVLAALDIPDPIVVLVRWFEKNIVKDTFNNQAAKGNWVYIFLDEIQDVTNWNAQIKHIADISSCRVFITGSSAMQIDAGKESLAGRVQWNEINTLGLSEIYAFRHPENTLACQNHIDVNEWKNREFWIGLKASEGTHGVPADCEEQVYRLFCDIGGYPFCHERERNQEEIEEYLQETIVARTISLDLQAKFESMLGGSIAFMNTSLLTNAFKTLCKYTGQDVSIEKLREELNSSYSINLKHEQIRKILEFFELSMLIKVVKPFEHRLNNQPRNVKVCLCDHAIRRAWMKEEIPLYGSSVNADLAGHIIEGIVGTLFKSIKQLGVSYFPPVGKGKNIEGEVDFILEIGVYHIPVEVKYKNHPDLGPGMQSFLSKEAYNAPFGLVITKDEVPLDHFSKDGNIIPISAKKLLMLK